MLLLRSWPWKVQIAGIKSWTIIWWGDVPSPRISNGIRLIQNILNYTRYYQQPK